MLTVAVASGSLSDAQVRKIGPWKLDGCTVAVDVVVGDDSVEDATVAVVGADEDEPCVLLLDPHDTNNRTETSKAVVPGQTLCGL